MIPSCRAWGVCGFKCGKLEALARSHFVAIAFTWLIGLEQTCNGVGKTMLKGPAKMPSSKGFIKAKVNRFMNTSCVFLLYYQETHV